MSPRPRAGSLLTGAPDAEDDAAVLLTPRAPWEGLGARLALPVLARLVDLQAGLARAQAVALTRARRQRVERARRVAPLPGVTVPASWGAVWSDE